MRFMSHRTDRRYHLALGVLAVVAGACAGGERAATDSAATAAAPDTTLPCTGDNAGLTLPGGICAGIFADSVGRPRDVVVAPNGDVYATLEGTAQRNPTSPTASVVAMRDTTRDGRADVIERFGSIGNTGIALVNGYLYVDEGAAIVRYRRGDDELVPSGTREVIVQNIPLRPGHRARNIAIGADGALYLNVGSASNSCQQRDRKTASPGTDPCTELETRAGIWRFDANRTGQSFSPSARYATGIRNAMGLAVRPGDGTLFATQHGRDQLHDNWPKVFPSTEYQAQNPGEELVVVNQGDDFGWPYCYYAMDAKHLVLAPEYGGDGKEVGRCAQKKEPIAAYPGHWAPMSLLFYTGSALPARYRDGVFIAFHGSWNRAPEPQEGYRVVFQPLSGTQTSGEYETFANGFAALPDSALQPDRAAHRPAGLAQGPDGAIYVTDDAGGRVYRIAPRAR